MISKYNPELQATITYFHTPNEIESFGRDVDPTMVQLNISMIYLLKYSAFVQHHYAREKRVINIWYINGIHSNDVLVRWANSLGWFDPDEIFYDEEKMNLFRLKWL